MEKNVPKTKEELFQLCRIDESHSKWESRIDNWISVEIYRAMHGGQLPDPNQEATVKYIFDFNRNPDAHIKNKYFGSMFLTSKRLIYRHWEQILKELNP